MQRPQFAELLADRRRQLRLSVPQAARVLRMRESVLEAFEIGDFDHLPALGYAQGMVASYARYLGLDPRRITELYEREHAEYVAGVTGRGSHGPRSPLGRARPRWPRLGREPGALDDDGPCPRAHESAVVRLLVLLCGTRRLQPTRFVWGKLLERLWQRL